MPNKKRFSPPKAYIQLAHTFKGSVSRDLRWVLLYINGKLFLRPIIAENFKFIKGLVHNLHKTGRRTLVYYDMALSRQY